ncbi:MAG: hypothetical protein KC503_13035, partial [Myxococcales bacterium]|nr:hypothetical protein [Myxococcales bacterium]
MLVDDAQFFLSEARAAATPLEQAEGLLDAAFWTLADGGQRSRDALAFVDEADRTLETLAPGTDDDRARVRVVRQRLGELLLELDEPERAVEQLLGCADSRTELDLGTRVGAALLTAHQLFDMPRALEILDETERELPQRACIAALQLSMHARRRDVDGQIEAATRLGARLRCPRQRASALLAAARLLASRGAAHDARVATLCREATTLDDGSSSARELLVCTAERLGRWDVVVSERATLARVRDGAERTRLLYAAAVAASERLGDQSRARELLVEASREASRELSADRTITLWRLAEMQRGGNCSERERLDTLVKLASATWDRARRAEVLVEAAEVCAHAPSDEVVGGDERAVNYCEQALASEPGYLPALQLLGRIARRRGDLSRLVPVYRREVETLAIPERRALRALECSELSLRIGRLAEAEEALGRVLDLDPENPVAYARLAALLRVRQGWWELARRSARQLEHAKDPSTRAALCKTLDALRARGTEYPLDENERSARAELEPCEPVDLTLFASAAHLALRGQGASRRRDALERIAALEGRAGDSRDATERRWARIEA